MSQRAKRAHRRVRDDAGALHAQRVADVGAGVVRFQEGSHAFDDLAAQVLAVDRRDLPCMTMLLFGGPASLETLTALLRQRPSVLIESVGRLQRAGYVRRRPDGDDYLVEVTEHAREWIARIWDPLREDGERLLGACSARELETIDTFMERVCGIQEQHVRRLGRWLTLPASTARRPHLRGGLSPAALKRVQLFVEANLEGALHLRDLAARAGLSVYHFARAFRTSAGVTPRAFIEQRRVERARVLMERSDQSLAQIAAAVGFGTQSRLTIAFKRRTGFTPSQYRRDRPVNPDTRRSRQAVVV